MHEHKCGAHCYAAARLESIVTKRQRCQRPRVVPVQTWCRVCGEPAFLEVLTEYSEAVDHLYALDDMAMNHKSIHVEVGGWGVAWRLDDVLSLVFPRQHQEVLWPLPAWWRQSRGEPMSEEKAVRILTEEDRCSRQLRYMDHEMELLTNMVNRRAKSIFQLSDEYGDVWGENDVKERFELFGTKGPFRVARCKLTGAQGTLLFQEDPRYYFGWDPERII